MKSQEDELRRALDARSEEVSPEFRARLSSALAEGRPASNLVPALAAVAAVVLVFATVGVLLLARQARNQPPPIAASTPSASAMPSPSAASFPVAGVLNKPQTPIALPTWVDLSAPSTNVLWALVVNQYLYRSTDRGATWKQRPLPPSSAGGYLEAQVSFVSDQEGWLSTGGELLPCGAGVVAIWHTTDAGATWQSLGANGVSDKQCKGQPSFVDSNHGFLDAFDDAFVVVPASLVYRTTDGGKTWAAGKPLPDPPSSQSGGVWGGGRVHAFGSTLLVAASAPQRGAIITYVFRSTDGGATWNYLATAEDPNNGVAFVTATRWIQVIAPGRSFETTDSGATWHPFRSDYSQAATDNWPDVVFADSRVGYATVLGSIVSTLDGGLHWDRTAIKTPGT